MLDPVDWNSWTLLENVPSSSLQLCIPQTVILADGQLHSWWMVSSSGHVAQAPVQDLRLDSIREGLLSAAQHDVGNYSCYVAVAHFPGERPRLLRRQALAELCSNLRRNWESQARGEGPQTEIPDAIQSYLQPLLDAVYTTEYNLHDGVPVCHTEQQPFTSSVEELPASLGRLPSTPVRALPAAPVHVGTSLKQKFRAVALALAAHLRRILDEPPTRFSFRCIRDAHGRFCISSLCVPSAAPPASHAHALPRPASAPASPWARAPPQRPTSARPYAAPVQSPPDTRMQSRDGGAAAQSAMPHAAAPMRQLSSGGACLGPPQRPASAYAPPAPRSGSLTSFSGRPRPQTAHTPAPSRFRRESSRSGSYALAAPAATAAGKEFRAGGAAQLDGHSLRAAVDQQGIPRVVQALARELDILRGELVLQHELLESHSRRANKAEHERQAGVNTYGARLAAAQEALEEANAELATLRRQHSTLTQQAASATERARTLEARVKDLGGTLEEERATTVRALGQYQARDSELARRVEVLEEQLATARGQLQEEGAAVVALKRQSLSFQQELQQMQRDTPKTLADAGLQDVLATLRPLLEKEANPGGERYALQKTIQTHSTALRSTFLYYCQLDTSFANHWPPAMHQHQWLAFCRDSETADPRIGSRMRANGQGMLPISEAQEAFDLFASNETGEYATLMFEGFVAALVWVSSKVKPHNVQFLSEAFRTYVTRYVNRANHVQPPGPKAGKALPGSVFVPHGSGNTGTKAGKRGKGKKR
eukprot:jgi/Ulvmu1/564/UM001_0572.1